MALFSKVKDTLSMDIVDERDYLSSIEKLSAFVDDFSTGRLPASAFDHPAHVATAAFYLCTADEAVVRDRLRQQIRAFNVAKGGSNSSTAGYHETLTRFWIERIAMFLRGRPPAQETIEVIRAAVREFGPQGGLFRSYYSFDVAASPLARESWIAPDRIPANARVKARAF